VCVWVCVCVCVWVCVVCVCVCVYKSWDYEKAYSDDSVGTS